MKVLTRLKITASKTLYFELDSKSNKDLYRLLKVTNLSTNNKEAQIINPYLTEDKIFDLIEKKNIIKLVPTNKLYKYGNSYRFNENDVEEIKL